MSDIRTEFTGFVGDWLLEGPGLKKEDGLETAVILSLFTDRRAKPGDKLPSAATDLRGWWGDSFPQVRGDQIGSRLWLLARSKQLTEVLNSARDYARESLLWLIEDGIARAVKVDAEIVRTGVLGLAIEITRANKPVAQYRFELFWKGQ
jgi:phage gp46-like protein